MNCERLTCSKTKLAFIQFRQSAKRVNNRSNNAVLIIKVPPQYCVATHSLGTL